MNKQPPYQYLGNRLRMLREAQHESLHDVSDAIEIDFATLRRYETGQERPSEDVLLMIFSHFAVEEPHAVELWRLAGYDGRPDGEDTETEHDHQHAADLHQAVMVMVDPRIMYSDGVEAIVGDRGVVLNFSQVNGPGGQPFTVSRIGMSREQAQMLMGVLHQVLYEIDNPNTKKLGDGQDKPLSPEDKTNQ